MPADNPGSPSRKPYSLNQLRIDLAVLGVHALLVLSAIIIYKLFWLVAEDWNVPILLKILVQTVLLYELVKGPHMNLFWNGLWQKSSWLAFGVLLPFLLTFLVVDLALATVVPIGLPLAVVFLIYHSSLGLTKVTMYFGLVLGAIISTLVAGKVHGLVWKLFTRGELPPWNSLLHPKRVKATIYAIYTMAFIVSTYENMSGKAFTDASWWTAYKEVMLNVFVTYAALDRLWDKFSASRTTS
jgi:hypothetical protein